MDFYIVIPAHNEEGFIEKTLQSLVEQTLLPKKVMVVNDHSTDHTQNSIDAFTKKYPFIDSIIIDSEENHAPGSKVINAFYKGFEMLDANFQVLCKFDADLIFPENYLEHISKIFQEKKKCGMVGGFCYIEENGKWILENLTNKDHIRGALKAYSKKCFEQIGGLKKGMGWDTIDELLAQYHGWNIQTVSSLKVKHLKPTGKIYTKAAKLKQGQAFKRMRYGFILTLIASVKLAIKKRSFSYFINCIEGYFSIKSNYLVTPKEGKFIRQLRWKNIRKKLLQYSMLIIFLLQPSLILYYIIFIFDETSIN